ncbi:MAG TPA: YsnF/AvaK domain-containing protein [Candidatus Nitrosocosmicus sp.]|nr:YsnF/AvaK domain-containing protein [Candidatus Nitrosocosmicus sp.]
MSSENDSQINWNEVIGKEALGENGLDIGTIKEISTDFVVTEIGMLNKKIYHLPKTSAKYFNGVFLNFSLKESDLPTYEQKIKENILNDDPFSESPNRSTKEEELSIPLISEDLQVTKTIAEDNIKIVKEPIKETKTVELELMREEVTIERRSIGVNEDAFDKGRNTNLSNDKAGNLGPHKESESEASMYSKKVYSIPIKREEPLIRKNPFVREEVIIKKKPITVTKTIEDEVTTEEIKYDNEKIEKNKDRIPI